MAHGALSAGSTSVGEYTLLRRLESVRGRLFQARKSDGTERTLAFFDLRRGQKGSVYSDVWRCRRLSQPGILRVVEAMSQDDQMVLVFESVPGMSLLQLMRHLDHEGERLADRALLHVGHTLFLALAEAHGAIDEVTERPILHGELGPHQVLMSWRGEVKVLGFGLSSLYEAERRASPDWLLPFVAPEVRRRGLVTPAANVYSAAAILWSLLARRAPPRLIRRPPLLRQLRADLDEEISGAIDRMLDLTPSRRPPAAALAELLGRHASGGAVEELRWNMEVVRATRGFADEAVPSDAAPLADRSWHPRPSLGPFPDFDPDDDVPTREMVLPRWLVDGAAERETGARSVSGVQPALGADHAPLAHSARPWAPEDAPGPPRIPERRTSRPSDDAIEVVVEVDATSEAPRREAARAATISALPPRSSNASSPRQSNAPSGPEGSPDKGMTAESSAGASPTRPSFGWLGAIAVVSIASFAGGLFASQLGIELRLGAGREREVVPRSEPPARPAPPPWATPRHESRAPSAEEPPDGATDTTHTAAETETTEATEKAEATEESTPFENEHRMTSLPPDRGLLRVSFVGDPSGVVYVNGIVVGDVGATLEIDCGMRFLRVGDAPLLRWFSAGQPVQVACQALTEAVIEPGTAALDAGPDDPYAAIPTQR
jgi:serine/threonine protein kinase